MNDKTDKGQDDMLKGQTETTTFCGYTCIGGRQEDQDCMAFDNANGRQVYAVCDGMGGHAGGCVASDTAARTLVETLRRQAEVVPTLQAVTTAVAEANAAIYSKAQAEPRLRGMGTTLTLLVIDHEAAFVTHVGDSRIYQFRQGKKLFRTFDHSMVFRQVAVGKLTEEEARQHPRSNELSRALGVRPEVDFDVVKLPFRRADRFVLCCDGVWNTQPEPDVINMLTSSSDTETTAISTRTLVEKMGRESGGHHDNHTMIAVDMKVDSKYQKSLLARFADLFRRRRY